LHPNPEVGRLLIARGADVNLCNRQGNTPLMSLLRCARFVTMDDPQDLSFARSLIRRSTNLGARDKDGKTALTLAREAKWQAVVRLLQHRR